MSCWEKIKCKISVCQRVCTTCSLLNIWPCEFFVFKLFPTSKMKAIAITPPLGISDMPIKQNRSAVKISKWLPQSYTYEQHYFTYMLSCVTPVTDHLAIHNTWIFLINFTVSEVYVYQNKVSEKSSKWSVQSCSYKQRYSI